MADLADGIDTTDGWWADIVRQAAAITGTSSSGERLCACGRFYRRTREGGADRGRGRRFCSVECYHDWQRAESARKAKPTTDEGNAVRDALRDDLEHALAALRDMPTELATTCGTAGIGDP